MTKVGYLGPSGTYSHLAAQKLCCGCEHIAYPSFRAMFSALEGGELGAIVVPVENTVNGAVTQNLDLLEECGTAFATDKCEVRLDHRLIMQEGACEEDITDVYSHPQALMQCERFLSSKLPKAKLHEVASTVDGLKKITGKNCAGIVGAHIQPQGFVLSDYTISDEKTNYTTFLKVVKGVDTSLSAGADRIFFTLICQHKAGALCSVLSVLSEHAINMTKIESRPIKDKLNEFRFFIEIQSSYEGARAALEKIEKLSLSFKLLGIY